MKSTICAVVAAALSLGCGASLSALHQNNSSEYRGEIQTSFGKKSVYYDGNMLCERRGPSTYRELSHEIVTPEVCYLLGHNGVRSEVEQICTVERHNRTYSDCDPKEHRSRAECFYRSDAAQLVPGAFPEAQRRVDLYLSQILQANN